jgi:hypothetical protein
VVGKTWVNIKKTFTCSEKSEEARAEFREKSAKIPEETRACIDDSRINKPFVREYGRALRGVKTGDDVKSGRKLKNQCDRGENQRQYCRSALLFQKHDKRLIRRVVQDEVCQSDSQRYKCHNG